MKKYGNAKWKRNQKNLSRILLKAKYLFMHCYAMCKNEFHDLEIRKMKRSNGIELF